MKKVRKVRKVHKVPVHAAKGKLIALEGLHGRELKEIGRALVEPNGRRGGVSGWDASGIFTELAVASTSAGEPSARTLALLYAADLAFRLRWEIVPAMAEGKTVVAAPYVETAIALAASAGVPVKWLSELFRFAPQPDAAYRLKEHLGYPIARGRTGYAEFFCRAIKRGGFDPDDIRRQSVVYLEGLNLETCSVT